MNNTPLTPTRRRRFRMGSILLGTLIFVDAALFGLAMAPTDRLVDGAVAAVFGPVSTPLDMPPGSPPGGPAGGQSALLGEADGVIPDGASVFDDQLPAIANLDPDLLDALQTAAIDAELDGVTLSVTSGWRSPEYQERLFSEAVAEYGSEAEAARWVATVDTSAHVTGDAVDIGPADAATWLSDHGADYGLCQIYDNEPWHVELRPAAITDGCPSTYADASQDPRSNL